MKVAGWGAGVLVLLLLVVGLLVYMVLQTRPGHDFLLRTALNQAPAFINGDLQVASLRSDGLLRGFSLHGVSIDDHRGRPFLEADSVRVRYSARDFLDRRVEFSSADLWGARIVVEILHGDAESNVARIFVPDEPDVPEEEATGLTVLLRNVSLHDSEFLLRLPLEADEAPPRMIAETVPGIEGLHLRYHFTDIDAQMPELDLLRPGGGGERIEVDRMSLVGQVFDDPFELADLRGTIVREGTRLTLDLDRLWLPGTETSGLVALDWGDLEEGLNLDVELEAPVVQLADLQWLEPRIPQGEGRLDLSVQGPVDRSQWRLSDVDLTVGESRLRGRVGMDLGDALRLVDTQVEALPLHLSLLDPWLEEPVPVQGRVEGRLAVSGPLAGLTVDGEVTYDDPDGGIPPSTVALSGGISLGEELEARSLSVRIDPLRYGTLRAFAPDLEVEGEGSLQMELSGGMASSLTLTAELVHAPSEGQNRSRLLASGTVRQLDGSWVLDLDGNLDPLDLDGLALGLNQELPISGELTGPVRLAGALEDLSVEGNLSTPAGRVEAQGRLNALDPASRYQIAGDVQDFALHRLLPDLPEPTRMTGAFSIDGSGITLETVEGTARIELTALTVGGAEADEFTTRLAARDGRLVVDSLNLRSPLVKLVGEGSLGLRADSEPGEVQVAWEVESLEAFRPLLMGDTVIAGDTLTAIERLDLRMQGIDPDTLPAAMAVALDGQAEGMLNLRGTFQDLTGDGTMQARTLLYGPYALDQAQVDFTGWFQDRAAWGVEGEGSLEGLVLGDQSLESLEGVLSYSPGAGEARLALRRDEMQAYRVGGTFVTDSLGVGVALDEFTLDLEDVAWSLAREASLRLEGRTLTVDTLRLTRPALEEDVPGRTGARIEARGTVSLEGESEFRIEAEGADIHRLATIFGMVDPPQGFLDLELDLLGPYDDPQLQGHFILRELLTGETLLSRVEGTLDYRGRLARAELMADMDGRRLLTVQGRVPVDLALQEVEDRFLDRNLEIDAQIDSFPAASALAFLEVLEGVEGVLDGHLRFRGTPGDLRPSGEVALGSGAVSLPELGLRITGIGGTLSVREDQTVVVNAEARAGGTARVEGTISLEDITDAGFDLRIRASNFQAVDRRDLNARVGGEVTLTGSFTAPRVGGDVRLEQGTIFVEEFARTAEVVDLSDPSFFDVVDTTLVATRPALEAAQNPFMQNLRVDVDLILQRDVWLRSREMNVEMGGELIVTFDRPRREILLVGTLEAIRGSYSAFGRQFQVQEGVVEFVGTPGIDPALDIQAVHRLRREGGEPLDIVANVGGSLTNLRVDLSSDSQPPIGQSDLISYLVFGRPSFALAGGERSILEGAAGAGVSVGVGAIATQLGQVVAQQFGVDYFTITQTREAGGLQSAAGISGTFADTQIEVGQYVADNLFLALTLRPLTGLGARASTQFPGARLEWRFSDSWTVESFLEDRFAREAASGFGELGLRLDKVLGLSIYREWGY